MPDLKREARRRRDGARPRPAQREFVHGQAVIRAVQPEDLGHDPQVEGGDLLTDERDDIPEHGLIMAGNARAMAVLPLSLPSPGQLHHTGGLRY